MFDFKCSMQAQLDNLWLKPEDLARGINVRVSSVRKWLDPELDCVPVKDAFDWVYDQTEKLGNLTMRCLNEANESARSSADISFAGIATRICPRPNRWVSTI